MQFTNYLITESEVVTAKSQTEALPYVRSIQLGRGLRFCCNDQMVKVINISCLLYG